MFFFEKTKLCFENLHGQNYKFQNQFSKGEERFPDNEYKKNALLNYSDFLLPNYSFI